MRRRHSFECPRCGEKYAERNRLYRHMRNKCGVDYANAKMDREYALRRDKK